MEFSNAMFTQMPKLHMTMFVDTVGPPTIMLPINFYKFELYDPSWSWFHLAPNNYSLDYLEYPMTLYFSLDLGHTWHRLDFLKPHPNLDLDGTNSNGFASCIIPHKNLTTIEQSN